MAAETLRTLLNAKVQALKQDRDASWLPHWRELNQFVLPMQGRFITSDRNNGRKRNEKIANESATFAVETARRGMMYNVTNPARPWMLLKTPWPELNKQQPVKVWLETLSNRILDVFQRSNVYTELPKIYADILVYGTAASCMNRDAKSTVRMETFPIGSYALATDGTGRVDTCVREFQLTRRQLVQKFGLAQVSDTTAKAWKENQGLEQGVDVVHVLDPNPDYKPGSPLAMHKRFRSVYYEVAAVDGQFLAISGFDSFRILTPRWDVQESDAYGTSPCMSVLGTIKGLQTLEKQSLQLLAKVINPPLNVPSGMKGQMITQLPGGLNYVSGLDQGKVEPSFQINAAPLAAVEAKIQNYEGRLRKALFEDVFLMIAQMDEGVTATEVRARIEQKIQTLGPILLRLNDELLDQMIETTFEIMCGEQDMVPPAPPELQGKPLQVEYISEMAKAMKLAGVSGIERTVGFVTSIAQFKPQILDNLNEDKIASLYAELSGAPVDIMNQEEAITAIRQKREAQLQQAQAMQKAQVSAEVANKMGNTPTGGDTLLEAAGGSDVAD